MFTGIVQEIGHISCKEETDSGIFLEVKTQSGFLKDLSIGASIAVNGVCLTVVKFTEDSVSFDVIPETLRVTNLELVSEGSEVNLERSLKFGDEVGGHILSGHISCKASSRLVKSKEEIELVVECPEEWNKYILLKGYIAINGASLTIAKKTTNSFSVFLIPETLDATNLSQVSNGDLLNIEIDQSTYATINAAEYLISKN
jgi:riboflavin synthase